MSKTKFQQRRQRVADRLMEVPTWSDRRLAVELDVTRDLVRAVREGLVSDGRLAVPLLYDAKDGRRYTRKPWCRLKPRTHYTVHHCRVLRKSMALDGYAEQLSRIAGNLTAEDYRWASAAERALFHAAVDRLAAFAMARQRDEPERRKAR